MSSKANTGKRIVVVLGMHRTGTSAIARGLKALGVELGERLMPPVEGNNEKGFWEDVDTHTLDSDLLQHLGLGWDSLGPIDGKVLMRDDLGEFRERAVALLRGKLADVTVFGLKDPRISRLLPFWKVAFDQVGAEVSYVISARHPLSVARSLNRRDRMDAETSHYLWLDHFAACMRDSEGARRVVVDYDLLMANPEKQLRRVANALGLPFDPESDEFKEYAKEFLADDLRHSSFGLDDLNLMSDILEQLLRGYGSLQRMARDEISPDAPEIKAGFESIIHRLGEIRPAFAHISRKKVDSARDMHIAHLEQEVRTRDGHITNLQAIVGDREARIAVLGKEAARLEEERSAMLRRLRLQLADELSLARECASRLREGEFPGVAIPPPLREARARLEQYAGEIAGLGEWLDVDSTEARDNPLQAVDRLAPARQAAWAGIADAAGVLGQSLVESAHELEISRLRLSDSLRQVSRDEDRISRLKDTVTELQALLAYREAEIRNRDAAIAERQSVVERLDAVLGQPGHRFVSRLGRTLAPYPGLRAVIRAPLTVLRWLAGRPGN